MIFRKEVKKGCLHVEHPFLFLPRYLETCHLPLESSGLKHLSTDDEQLHLVAHAGLKHSNIDLGISCGYRSLEDQKIAFDEG